MRSKEPAGRPQRAEAEVAISERIAAFAAQCDYEALPERLRAFARHHMLDAAGTALAASGMDFAGRAYRGLAALEEGGESSVIGMRPRLPLRDAVLLNGILAHGLDYDDTHTASQVHPTVSAFPCALGLSERLGKSGREMLTAYLVGAEIATRIGIGANSTMQQQGFHPTGIAGHFGCAVAAAKLLGLSAEQTLWAQGLAGSTAAALGEYRNDGSWNKRMHPGWAGVGGITAAALARGGYVGSRRIYEGRDGLFRSHAGSRRDEVDPGEVTRDLGEAWRVEEAAIKPLPVCHLLHACADSAVILKREHRLEPEEITEACALLHPDAYRIVCEPAETRKRPASEQAAQFSAQYVIAACLVRGRIGFGELTAEARSDERILALAQRVGYDAYPESRYPRYLSGGVVVKTRDGRVLKHLEAVNRGNGERALSAGDITGKFMENAEMAMPRGRAARIRDLFLECEAHPARDLARSLSAA
jgi:2-methylcitrate dehydratase PrpD